MTPRPRVRRRWIVLAILALTSSAAGWLIHRQLQPEQMTAWVLREAGTTLGLTLTIEGMPDYALRPEPRLRLPEFNARLPGESTTVLHAAQLELSLPWRTLLGRDAAQVITRITLDSPTLDLAALRRWQATRPDTPFEVPTLTHGLRIDNGNLHDADWSLNEWSLAIASLLPDQPATFVSRGQFQAGEIATAFDGALTLTAASRDTRFDLSLGGDHLFDGRRVPYKLSAQGQIHAADDALELTVDPLNLHSTSPLPDFSGHLTLTSDTQLRIEAQGQLASWPSDWPMLPSPLSQSSSALHVSAAYQGDHDLSGEIQAHMSRDDDKATARLRWPLLQAWLDDANAPPLPPVEFSSHSTQIYIDGAVLEGVRIELSDPSDDLP